jgi:hypothetical protein
MKKIYYDESVDDESPDFFEEDGFMTAKEAGLDDPEELDAEEEEKLREEEIEEDTRLTSNKIIDTAKNLIGALRTELGFLECDRGVLAFRQNGINYEGVPMLEINPNKFVFKVTSDAGDKDVMKAFQLSNIRINK